MKIILIVWLIIGVLINLYYHVTKAQEYAKMLRDGNISVGQFMLGGFLTIFLWPVAIYNNEFRPRRKVDKDD